MYDTAWNGSIRHDRRGNAWGLVDLITGLALALVASLSAISILVDNTFWAALFAIVTAAASAVNAALKPGSKAADHRRAARGYHRLLTPLGAIISAARRTQQHYNRAGHVVAGKRMKPEDLKRYSDVLIARESELDSIYEAAPALPTRYRVQSPPIF